MRECGCYSKDQDTPNRKDRRRTFKKGILTLAEVINNTYGVFFSTKKSALYLKKLIFVFVN